MIRHLEYEDIPDLMDLLRDHADNISKLPINPDHVIDYLRQIQPLKQFLMIIYEENQVIMGITVMIISPYCFNRDIKQASELIFWADSKLTNIKQGRVMLKMKNYIEKWCIRNEVHQILMTLIPNTALTRVLKDNGYIQREESYIKELIQWDF